MNKRANLFDIYSENFDKYFEDLVDTMTPVQKAKLPDAVLTRLFVNKKNRAGAMEFREKMYILSVCFNKRIVVSVEDEDEGISPEDYNRAVKAQSAAITNTNLLGDPRTGAGFVLADKNLMNSLMYLNHVYTTEIYGLLRPILPSERSKKDNEFLKGVETVKHIINLILNYEMYKKRIVQEFDFTMAEIYAILYFSLGEKTGVQFYKKDFKYSYNANYADMFQGMKRLSDTGYLTVRGKPFKYSLSAKGIDVLNKIVLRIVSFYK